MSVRTVLSRHDIRPSAGACATLLPHLGDLGLELVEQVVWSASDNPIANQEKWRPLQVELLSKVLGFVEGLLDLRIFRVLLQLVDVESKLLGDP